MYIYISLQVYPRIDDMIRYIDPIHDTYRVIDLIKNIAETVIKIIPLAFGAGQFVDNTFSAVNLTCTLSRQLWHMTVTKELVSDSGSKDSYHCH